jgi:hypothetical protein
MVGGPALVRENILMVRKTFLPNVFSSLKLLWKGDYRDKNQWVRKKNNNNNAQYLQCLQFEFEFIYVIYILTFGYRTSQRVTYISLQVQIILA